MILRLILKQNNCHWHNWNIIFFINSPWSTRLQILFFSQQLVYFALVSHLSYSSIYINFYICSSFHNFKYSCDHLFFCLFVCLYICLCMPCHLFICINCNLFNCIHCHLFIFKSCRLFICISCHLFICISGQLFICISCHLFICTYTLLTVSMSVIVRQCMILSLHISICYSICSLVPYDNFLLKSKRYFDQ